MERLLPRVLTAAAMCACGGLLVIASCTKTTDRVVEPVGGGDASTTVPEVADASVSPLGPLARPPTKEENPPSEDFRLARSPELGVVAPAHAQLAQALTIKSDNALGGAGGTSGNGGAAGRGAPVGTGAGFNYF